MRSLVKTSAAAGLAAGIGALASQDVNTRWYRKLSKPPFQPPSVAFPIVWTALYSDVAISSAVVVDRLHEQGRHIDAAAFERALYLNLVLNGSWTWVFFKAHRLDAATATAGVLTLSCVDLVRRAQPGSPMASAALVPYAAWCAFATVLSAAIWRRNR
ncbi:tryptophan-rich sensory protein [Williamsia muralis]|uniref:TspO/MBR family protein n=1 Tax=Williamsia marianensis TaxID=85044 RepID=UPI003F1590D1